MPAPLSGVNQEALSTEALFLGHRFGLPLFISSMTGGTQATGAFNDALGRLARTFRIPFGLGSIRPLLEDPGCAGSFDVKRRTGAPFVAANIGAVQLCRFGSGPLNRALELLDADALFVHLNVIQELAQPQGDRDFSALPRELPGVIPRIERPVIVKETGAGLDRATASFLADAGAVALDVAGCGGSSFLDVEMAHMVSEAQDVWEPFRGWGIPSAASILVCSGAGLPLIGSGGLRSGLDLARAIALGADFGGVAGPLVKAWSDGGEATMERYVERLASQLRSAMVLTGAAHVQALSRVPFRLGPELARWLEVP